MQWLQRNWSYAHRCLVSFVYRFFYGIAMELMISLGALCIRWITGIGEKNVQVEYASECTKTAFTQHRLAPFQMAKSQKLILTLTKFGAVQPSKITVHSKRRSSNYVVFPERQSYFTYGALHSSGLENHAFQLTIL